MKLLKLRVEGAGIFKNDAFELDFIASDRVPRDEEGNIADVTAVAGTSTVYTQNVMSLVGVNASGKTTALNFVRFVLGYMSGSYSMRGFALGQAKLGKISPRVAVSCVFHEAGSFYLIDSTLTRASRTSGASDGLPLGEKPGDVLVFEDETLWKCSAPRVSRKLILDIDAFRSRSEVLMKRRGPDDDKTVLGPAQRTFLGDDMSIVSMVTGRRPSTVQTRDRTLPLITMPTPVIQAFDPSVEYLKWDTENQVFHLKFKNGGPERVVSDVVAASVLSNGTVLGAELVDRATCALADGGYLIVDEIETGLNRSLVSTVIELFASPVTNPNGAVMLFSTHYPELLDALRRKDNVYVLVRDSSYKTAAVKYSDQIKRIENKKSEALINNMIKGSMPRYPDVQAMRDYVCEHVNG